MDIMLRHHLPLALMAIVGLVGCTNSGNSSSAADSVADAPAAAHEAAPSQQEAHQEAGRASTVPTPEAKQKFVAPPVLDDGSPPGDANDTPCARRATDRFNRCQGENCITEYDKALDRCGSPR